VKRWLKRACFVFLAPIMLIASAYATQARWLPYAIAASCKGPLSLVRSRQVPACVSRQMRVNVGPPTAHLALWILEPPTEPRGTVLVLHGVQGHKRNVLQAGESLAREGYRAVLVDLRGHGESSGAWLTFGVQDARDLSQVLDALERERLLAEPVAVYGTSYGAAAALIWAGQESRVRAVVSVAPFTTMREEVPSFMRGFHRVPRWFVSDAQVQESIGVAGRLAGFDPQESSPLAAIQRTQAAVLLLHGTADAKIPVEHARRLHAAADRHRAKLVIVEGAGHDSLFYDETGLLARATADWFRQWLTTPNTSELRNE